MRLRLAWSEDGGRVVVPELVPEELPLLAYFTIRARPFGLKNMIEPKPLGRCKRCGRRSKDHHGSRHVYDQLHGVGYTTKAKGHMREAAAQIARQWHGDEALCDSKGQWSGRPSLPGQTPFNVAVIVFQDAGQSVDLSNLYQGPEDALEDAGVLPNDYWIVGHHGSGRFRDETRPRTEIVITPPW